MIEAATDDATLTELAREILGPEAADLYSARKLRDFARRARRVLDEREQLVNDADFEKLWTIYPRKQHKRQAMQAWRRLRPGNSLTAKIIEAAGRAHELGSDMIFIPYLATWLRDRRWEDED